jgi:hypothetical protein
MVDDLTSRADESVAARFTRTMNAATSPYGVLADLTLASMAAALPLVMVVRQAGAGELRSPVTYLLVAIAAAPLLAAVVVSLMLRNARAGVVAWLAKQPFPIENVNSLLVGLTDTFDIVFEPSDEPVMSREALQKRLDVISEDTMATRDPSEERALEAKIGVIDSKRAPLRSTYQRWARFQRIVEEVLVPLHRERAIASLRIH